MSARKSGKAGQGATLLEVRHFIDGMHEYILSNRGVSLALLFEREKQRAMILQIHSVAEADSSSAGGNSIPAPPSQSPAGGRGITRGNSKRGLLRPGSDKASGDARNFQSPNSTAVVESELTSRASLQFLKDNNIDLSMIDEKIVVFISFVIFMVVEEAIFLPLKADLINLLPSSSKQVRQPWLYVHVVYGCQNSTFVVRSGYRLSRKQRITMTDCNAERLPYACVCRRKSSCCWRR
jgi:hypothetical protein